MVAAAFHDLEVRCSRRQPFSCAGKMASMDAGPSSRRFRFSLRTFLVVMTILSLALMAGAHWLRENAFASIGFCVEARFETLPADDQRLIDWLKTEPGIVAHSVTVERIGDDKKSLRVHFIQSRNVIKQDRPFPNFDAQCVKLGYLGPDGTFRDCAAP
jgi:hypothetical protein